MSNQRFDILLTGFPNGPRNAPSERVAIQQVFRVDAGVAAQILANLPKVVRREATRIEVRKFANAFAHIGGAVELRHSETGAVVPLSGAFDASVAVGGPTIHMDAPGVGASQTPTLAQSGVGAIPTIPPAVAPAPQVTEEISPAPAQLTPNPTAGGPPARAPVSQATHYGRPSLSNSDLGALKAAAQKRPASKGGRPGFAYDEDDAVEALSPSSLVGVDLGSINFDSDVERPKLVTQAGNLAADDGDFSPSHARRLQTVMTPDAAVPINGPAAQNPPPSSTAQKSTISQAVPATLAAPTPVPPPVGVDVGGTLAKPAADEVKQTTDELPVGAKRAVEAMFDQVLGPPGSAELGPSGFEAAGTAAGRSAATRPDIDTGQGNFPKLSATDLAGGTAKDLDRLPRPSGANEPLFGPAADFSDTDSALPSKISDDDLFGAGGPNAVGKVQHELPDLKKSMMRRAEDVVATASAPSAETVPNVNEVRRDGPIDGFQAPTPIQVKPPTTNDAFAGPGLELDYSHKAPSPVPGVYGGYGAAAGAASSTTAGGFDFSTAGDSLPNAGEVQNTGHYVPPVYIPPAHMVDDGNDDFWSTVPECLSLPIRGEGLKWIGAAVMATVAAVLLQFGAAFMGLLGLLVAVVVWAAVLALCARFFQACAAATVSQSNEPNTMPDMGQVNTELIGPGLSLAFFAIVATGLPMMIWGRHLGETGGNFVGNPITYLLLAAPIVYWPMGLTLCADSGSTMSIWNIPRGVMGIMHAPLKYLFVVAVGLVTYMLPPLIGGLAASTGNIVLIVFGIAMACLPMIYSHGVMGALMGKLIRNTPEIVGR